MEIREKKEVIEKITKVYVSEDGKEWASEKDCIAWEKEIERGKFKREISKFEIKEMYDCMPINTDTCISDMSCYHWYKVDNEEDFLLIQKAYTDEFTVPKAYPEVICVEVCADESYYDYRMSNMVEVTKDFWKRLGYKVSFEKMQRRE